MSLKVSQIVRRARLPRSMPRRPEAKGILLALADRADDAGCNAWPSVATMAAEVEVSVRTAQKVLGELVEAGLVEEQARPTQHRPRTYRLNLVALQLASSDAQAVAPLNVNPGAQAVAPLSAPGQQETSSGAQHPTSGVQMSTPEVQPRSPDPSSMNGPLNGQENRPSPQTEPDGDPTHLLRLTKERLGFGNAQGLGGTR